MRVLRWLLVFLFAVAACSPPPASPPALPRAVLSAGTSGDYPPLSVWKDAHATGFAPALVTAFASTRKEEVRWSRFTWPGLVEDLRAGRFELAADGITVRPERSIAGRFTVPIARGGAVLLLRRPSWAPARGDTDGRAALAALDRAQLRVVVNKGGHLERVTRALLRATDIRAIPDNDAVRAAFASGEADAAMTNTFEAPRWGAGAPGVEEVGPLTEDVTALWVRADRADLADQLDAWLLDEEESGRLEALRAQWLGPGRGPRAALPLSALLAATAERLALMPFVAAAKQRAGKPIEDTTQEAAVLAASTDAVAQSARARGSSPPPREAVEAFYRAQIEAAKAVQRRPALAPEATAFRLDEDLRPAIARISARMAMLVVRLPRGLTAADVVKESRASLATTGLAPPEIDALAATIPPLTSPSPAGPPPLRKW